MADVLRDLFWPWLADSAGASVMLQTNGDARAASAPNDQHQIDLINEELQTIQSAVDDIRASVAAVSAMVLRLYDQRSFAANPARSKRHLSVKRIIEICAEIWQVSIIDITSTRRHMTSVKPRHAACWLARRYTPYSLLQIAREIGDRDHTSIMYAVSNCDRLRAKSFSYRETFEMARAAIEAEIEAMK